MGSNLHISKELQLVVDCCLDKELSIPANLQQDVFVSLVKKHRVVHQVYTALKKSEPSTTNLLLKLEPIRNRATRRMLSLSAALVQIETDFANKGIDALSFKGPTLSSLAYGDINSRFCRDLDLLVKENQIDDAQKALLNLGFTQTYPDFSLTQKQKQYFISSYDQMVFVRKNPHTVVELHWRLFQNKHLFNTDIDDLFERKKEVSIGPKPGFTLPLEELVIYAVTHGAKHKWEKLYWLLDFYKLCQNTAINWDQTLAKAEKHDLKAVILQAVSLCRVFFDSEFLASTVSVNANDARVELLTNKAYLNIINESKSNSWIDSTLKSLSYRIKLKSGLAYRLGYFRGISVYDFKYFKLPDSIFVCYYLLRPLFWALRLKNKSNES